MKKSTINVLIAIVMLFPAIIAYGQSKTPESLRESFGVEIAPPAPQSSSLFARGLSGQDLQSPEMALSKQTNQRNLSDEVSNYFWAETFDTGIPGDWTIYKEGNDQLYWYDSKVVIYRSGGTTTPLMLVSPAIDIDLADLISFYVGSAAGSGSLAFGTITDPSDPETFTELMQVTPGSAWEVFEYDLTSITSSNVYFAWQYPNADNGFYYIDNVAITGGSDVFDLTFNVEDQDGLNIEGAQVKLGGIGTQLTNAEGVTVFEDVTSGVYAYNVQAYSCITTNGDVSVIDQNVSKTVALEASDYYWAETFDNNIPGDWTVHKEGYDYLSWNGGQVFFFRQSGMFNPHMLVSPAIDIDLDIADVIYFEMGNASTSVLVEFGTVTDPSDPETFTELMPVYSSTVWDTLKYNLTSIEASSVYFAWRLPTADPGYFYFDNVIMTKGEYGNLEGTVSSASGAIEGATITVAGFTATTDAAGFYSIMGIQTGTQTVNCSAPGHFDESESIVIEDEITTTLDFELIAHEFGNLEGTVKTVGGTPIEGATVTVAGFTATTDAAGFYSIMDILTETYNVNCVAYGYNDQSETVIIENEQTLTVDFDLEQMEVLPPSNFTAEVSGGDDVDMNWDSPNKKSFLGYNIYRDGAVIAEEILETNYVDINLGAGTYSYDVKAVYDEGVSEGAGAVEVTIGEFLPRQFVIVEIGTATWCGYCPGAAMGADDLVENGHNVGVIEYHKSDDYETPETIARLESYGITGYPTAYFDKTTEVVGGSSNLSMYDTYLPIYEERINTPTTLQITEAKWYNIQGDEYGVEATVEMMGNSKNPGNLVVQVVLTESHMSVSWQGMNELNFVCRDMIPDQDGTVVDFSSGNTQSITESFNVPSDYNFDNLELVVFVQDMESQEVLQGALADRVPVAITEINSTKTHIYPNPAYDKVNIKTSMDVKKIQLVSFTGQLVLDQIQNSNQFELNTSELKAGIYFIKVFSHDKIITRKLVIE